RSVVRARAVTVVAMLTTGAGLAMAQAPPTAPLNGVWTLNRALSAFPKEIGFSIDVPLSPEDSQGAAPSGRARRGSGGSRTSGNPLAERRESYEDGQRKQLITGEARNPPTRLMFVDSGAAVTITNDLGQSRSLRPSGRPEPVDIQGVVFLVTTRRDGDRLIATYQIEQDREVRYTYSPAPNPHRLAVDIEFLERGMGDKISRVYDAGTASSDVAAARPAQVPAGTSPGGASPPGAAAKEDFDQRPGAEFRGIKDIGILVEDLGSEAQACGLKREAIEDAMSRRLTAGGLSVRRNSDEDTYVYVNVITTAMPNGGCVSRYDAFLYTHATAKLAYHERPVLVQVSLMHRGGIGTSGTASHAAAVARGLEGYADVFVTQIRDANK
ncbi:MAG TPA: hypothetical protein VH277_14385, partial [Gemmatimonadaceae bacterium]|nr:hypothetical protein [Gemmatimonadaceae bacterium]